jgi:hypothetical protein
MIEFKENSLKDEFDDPKLDTRVRAIVLALAGFVKYEFGKDITITSVWRTKTTDSGVHEAWRAVDVRSIYFTDSEINEILLFLNNFFYGKSVSGEDLQTAICHDVGQGQHLHIQVSNSNFTLLSK